MPEFGLTEAPTPTGVEIRFLHDTRDLKLSGKGEHACRFHYMIGDADRHVRDVPAYRRVEMRSILPGIDVQFYGNGSLLEFDFIVAPGSDPSRIAMDIIGSKDVRIDRGGNLELSLHGQTIKLKAPVLRLDDEKRTPVKGRYVLRSKTRVGFEVDAYDRSQTLVIDPLVMALSLIHI